jgi:hypothetical protein
LLFRIEAGGGVAVEAILALQIAVAGRGFDEELEGFHRDMIIAEAIPRFH